MNSPILLIIQREFLTRIRKKTFLLMTLLAPVLLAAAMIVPSLLASMPEDDKMILVLDEPSILLPETGTEQFKLEYLNPGEFNLELAKQFLRESDKDALLYIPSGNGWDPDLIKKNILLYGKEDIGIDLQRFIERQLEEKINNQKLIQQGVDPKVVTQTKTQVSVKSFTLGEEDGNDETSATPLKMGLGYISGILIYFFIFFYAVQVMRGVIEEKTSRIVEVIISSVRPRQLMMGKILGIGLVGVVQFLIWVVLSGTIYTVVSTFIYPEIFAQQVSVGTDAPNLSQVDQSNIFNMIYSINFPLVLGGFVFYFFGGYFLYSALFAALGSAIDQEADSQQFMLPVTAPMIIAISTAMNIVQDPNGPIAFWMSMIPLTSPISMMVRIPFGVPVWQMALSASLLVGTFFGVVALAGKIYRVGILMYGKKVTWKELYKWLKY
ncbi:MAG TPA: ABC transporter permease [Cryomorphaceae bacterium]|nr:ABC transporter permease [Cryomorphaceae bacterium]|tara:strand:- start:857 stop:2167 length:1311 start_codon:yes stop_codon:yes gene_type:complete